MADSVYRVTEVIGVSSESWDAAARAAVEAAAKTVRDLRVAEVLPTRRHHPRRQARQLPRPPGYFVQVRIRRLTDGRYRAGPC
jgi:flavin-binding protein dodecin